MTGYEVVTFKGLKALGIPVSRTTLDRWEKEGKFPKSKRTGPHRNSRRFWWLSQIIEWLKSR